MPSSKKFDVFLSHHSSDKLWVIKLKNALEARGLSVWIDKDEIRPGDLFAKALEEGLKSSKSIIFIVSPDSVKSMWVEEEYYKALSLSKTEKRTLRLIPVVLNTAKLPEFLAYRNWVDFGNPTEFQQNIDKLVWGITGDLKKTTSAPIFAKASDFNRDQIEYSRFQSHEIKFSRPLRVFLCHCSLDKLEIRRLYSDFKSSNVIDPWLDEEKLLPGQRWQNEIPKAVRNSDIVLVCLSENSVDKVGYVQKEIKIALDAADEQPEDSIFIIPARLGECVVPGRLQQWQWVDLFKPKGIEKLFQSFYLRAKSLDIVVK